MGYGREDNKIIIKLPVKFQQFMCFLRGFHVMFSGCLVREMRENAHTGSLSMLSDRLRGKVQHGVLLWHTLSPSLCPYCPLFLTTISLVSCVDTVAAVLCSIVVAVCNSSSSSGLERASATAIFGKNRWCYYRRPAAGRAFLFFFSSSTTAPAHTVAGDDGNATASVLAKGCILTPPPSPR